MYFKFCETILNLSLLDCSCGPWYTEASNASWQILILIETRRTRNLLQKSTTETHLSITQILIVVSGIMPNKVKDKQTYHWKKKNCVRCHFFLFLSASNATSLHVLEHVTRPIPWSLISNSIGFLLSRSTVRGTFSSDKCFRSSKFWLSRSFAILRSIFYIFLEP